MTCRRHLARNWYDYMWVEGPVLEKNKGLKGKSIRELAKAQGKGIIDAFLDLVVEEKLETVFLHGDNNVDKEAMTQDPQLSQRHRRPLRRRRARAVPRRLWLQHAAAGILGARAADDVPGTGGAAADL